LPSTSFKPWEKELVWVGLAGTGGVWYGLVRKTISFWKKCSPNCDFLY
jgi:hypothetical protein